MKVAVVMPAFNVAKWIEAVIAEVQPLVDLLVVVDDGSTDDTFQLAAKSSAVVLKHAVNRGQGAALRTGTHWALEHGADIIVHFDADGQFRPQDIKRLTAPLLAGTADAVFGSRFLDNSTAMPAFKRKIIMPLARAVNKILFNVNLTDPQSGFRAFNAKAAAAIDWRQDRMAHASEILFLSHGGDWRVAEVPITVIYHRPGQNFLGGLKIIKELFIKNLI